MTINKGNRTKWAMTVLRIATGWHFLYEGLAKLFAEQWTSEGFLNGTHGRFSGWYHWLAASPVRLDVVDFLNITGLIVIGLALFIGLFSRWAALSGSLLLALYYFAYPPFGISLLQATDESVYVVNRLFVEATALLFLFFCKETGYGLDELRKSFRNAEKQVPVRSESRRELLKNLITLPVLGLIGWGAYCSRKLYGADVMSGATIQLKQQALSDLKGELPKGKLGSHEMSRLVMGGNLIGGWSHARDLIYSDQLFKAYNTEKRIFDTLVLCEQAGINTINIGYPTMSVMEKYRKITGSTIKVIVQVGIEEQNADILDNVTQAIHSGMDVIQLQGMWCDMLVRDNRLEVIYQFLDRVRKEGYVAGLGAHTIDSLLICEENGIIPDYYMKTMHHDNYWSAHPRENRKVFESIGDYSSDHNQFHNNVFCTFPERTVEFVNRAKIPVMGFKVLAAGAITPEDGFNWAFENGSDFICVGMFDFQIVEDVNICIKTLQNLKNRNREWFG
jgi:uncharacterized membrane protein YphA (DoxX/SURF4 family)